MNVESSEPIAQREAEAMSPWRGWLAFFLVFVVLYGSTASRGLQWQDSGLHIWRIVTGELLHPLGLALSHPLHHWIGRFVVTFDLIEPCFAITLISSVAAAVAVANTYGCVLTLTRSRIAGVFAAVSFGFAHTFWQFATLAETYPLTIALLTAECWCLAAFSITRHRRCFFGLFLLNGLGVANHMLAAPMTIVLGIALLRELKKKRVTMADVAIGVAVWILVSLPYTGLVVSEWMQTGDLTGTIHSALFGRAFADQVLNTAVSARMMLISGGFVMLNFPNLFLPAAAIGLARVRSIRVPGPAMMVFCAALLLHVGFAARYNIVDQHTFFLPAYALLAIFAGAGFAGVSVRLSARRRQTRVVVALVWLALTPVAYAVAPAFAKRFDVLRSVARNKPYRDDYIYIFSPWSVADRSAEKMSRHAVELVGTYGLILVEDQMAEAAVRYRVWRDGLSGVGVALASRAGEFGTMSKSGSVIVLVPRTVGQTETAPPFGGEWKRVRDLYVLEWESASVPDSGGPASKGERVP